MIEYVIWGIPPGQSDETLLVSESAGITTLAKAEQVAEMLRQKYGATAVRIQAVDLSDITCGWDARLLAR